MASSAIRELLKVTEKPDVISFAGGLPAPDVFPVEEIAEAPVSLLGERPSYITAHVLTADGGEIIY
jgi:2-aminoadipate transaminase